MNTTTDVTMVVTVFGPPDGPWSVVWGTTDTGLQIVGPSFTEWARAARVAAELARAWDREHVPVAPVVVIPNAAPLYEAIQWEIELTTDAWIDDHEIDDDSTLVYLSSLRSIEISGDQSVALNFDQALSVEAALTCGLMETAEEATEEGVEASGFTTRQLRQYCRELMAVGIHVTFMDYSGYTIKPTAEEQETFNYEVWHKGKRVALAETVYEAQLAQREHMGPLPGSQLTIPTES